jgi:membrane protein YdbS with pleckstrin-like domain
MIFPKLLYGEAAYHLFTELKEKKKLQLSKGKSAIMIALFLILTITVSSIALFPTANAVDTYASAVYVSVSPDVIGVNQQILLVMWTADIPPDTGEIATGGRAS